MLQDCAYLDPRRRHESASLNAVSRLVEETCKPLKSILGKIFTDCTSIEDVCDGIKTEWREFQIDVFPEAYFTSSVLSKESPKQASYWERVFELAGLSNDPLGETNTLDVDTMINSLENEMLVNGSIKYPKLLQFFKVLVSFPHGNSAPENGFFN